MKKFSLLFTLFLLTLLTIVANAENALIQSVDYIGIDGQLNAVGVEEHGCMLNLYQWQNGKLLNDTLLTTGNNICQPQIVLSNNGQKAVSFLQGNGGTLHLFFLIFHDGIWEKVNRPIDLDDKVSVEQHDLCMSDYTVYLAYIQNNELNIVKYDLTSKTSHHIYQEDLANNRILSLVLTRIGNDPVFAYTYEEQDQVHLRMARINQSGTTDWKYTASQINGFDLIGNDQHLYLVYDQKRDQTSNVFLYEIANGRYNLLSQFTRRDSAPFGVKLMLMENAVHLLYRDYGIAEPYDLFIRELMNQTLTSPELLPISGKWAKLNNIRDNLEVIDSSHLCLISKALDPIVSKQKPGYHIIDLEKGISESIWASNMKQTNLHQQSITVSPQSQIMEVPIHPSGVVTDSLGNVYILDHSSGRVCKVEVNQKDPIFWKASQLDDYEFVDCAINSQNEFYVVDRENHRIVVFDAKGQFVKYWGNPGNGEGQFYLPAAIAFDSMDNLYILDAGNQRVQRFDPEGRMTAEWGNRGKEPGQFLDPSGIAIDENNQIYVADTGNHRIQIFSDTGVFINQFGDFGRDGGGMIEPVDLAISNGKIYVVDQGNKRVQIFAMNLQYISEFRLGDSIDQAEQLTHIYVDKDGFIYLIDQVDQKVVKLSANLSLLTEWKGQTKQEFYKTLESWSSVDQQRYYLDIENQRFRSESNQDWTLHDQIPRIISGWTSYLNNIYCVDILNHTVVQYTTDGKFVRTIGSYGNQPGYLNHPQGIAVDSVGNIYVADTGNKRIQIFNSEGRYINEWSKYGLLDGEWVAPVSVSAQGENILVVDQGLDRVQMINKKGLHVRTWFGIGDIEGQIGLNDYLSYSPKEKELTKLTQMSVMNATTSSTILGLSNDDYPRKTKIWYPVYDISHDLLASRYVVDTSPSTIPTGNYQRNDSIEIGGVNGKYYLHITEVYLYLVNDRMKPVSGDTGHFYAYIDNTPPSSITISHNSSAPAKSQTFTWNASDIPEISTNIKSYRFMVTDVPPVQWTTAQNNAWNALTFSSSVTSTTLSGVTGLKYVTVQAKDYAGNLSQRYTLSFYMDNTPPSSITILHNSSGPAKSQTFTWSASDVPEISTNTLSYRFMVTDVPPVQWTTAQNNDWNALTFLSTATSTSLNGVTGLKYVTVQAKDRAGNLSQRYTLSFYMDNTAPTLSISHNSSAPAKSQTFTWSASDVPEISSNIQSYRFMVTDVPPVQWTTAQNNAWNALTFSSSVTSTTLSGVTGLKYVTVQAKDYAGNLSQQYTISFFMDNTAPILSSCIVKNNNGSLEATLTPADNYTTTTSMKYRYSITSVSTSVPTSGYTTGTSFATTFPSGTAYLHIQVQDMAGNESGVYHYLLDTTPPVVVGLGNNDIPIKSKTWTWSGSDNTSAANQITYRYSITSTSQSTITGGFTSSTSAAVTGITNGKAYLNIQAKDAIGNVSNVVNYYVNMDNTIPTISNCALIKDTDGTLKLTPSATDNMSSSANLKYRFTINANATATPTGAYAAGSEFHTPFPTGTSYLHLQAVDQAGNESTPYHIQIDTSAPAITGLADRSTPVKTFVWTWSGSDNTSAVNQITYRYSITSTLQSSITSSFTSATSATVTGITNGKAYLNIQAKDAMGNISDVANYYVNMDNTIPTVSSCALIKDTDGTLKLTPSASDNMSSAANLKYRFTINANATATPTGAYAAGSEFHTPFPTGTSYLHLQAVDQAGNESTPYHIQIDTSAPAITGLADRSTPVKTFVWTWSGSDNTSAVNQITYRYSITSTLQSSVTSSFTSATSATVTGITNGKAYLNIQAKDAMGNISDVANYYVNMDNTIPTISGCTLIKDTDGTLKLTPSASDNMSSQANLKYRFTTDANATAAPTGTYAAGSEFHTPFPTGTSYLHLQVTDQAGNESVPYHVQIDTSAPIVNSCGMTKDTDGRLKLTPVASDNMGVVNLKYRYSINSSSSGTPTSAYAAESVLYTTFPTGTAYLHLQAIDQMGNESAVYHVRIDTEAPAISGLGNHTIPVKSFTWAWSGSDNMGAENLMYRFSLTSGSENTITEAFKSATSAAATLSNGTQYINIQAKDAIGNLSPVYHFSVVLDNSAPSVISCMFKTDENGDLQISPVALDNLSTKENLRYRLMIDGNATGMPTGSYKTDSSYTVVFPTGTAYLHLQVIDQAGNESGIFHQKIDTIGLDVTPPAFDPEYLNWIGERMNPDSNVFKSAVTLKIPPESYYDVNTVTITYRMDGGIQQFYTESGIQITSDGNHEVVIYLTDSAGNTTEATLNVIIDLIPPQITLITSETYPSNLWSNQTSGTLTVSANDNHSQIKEYRFTVNQNASDIPVAEKDHTSLSNTITVSNLSNGIQYLHIQPVDLAGNIGPTFTYALQVDTTTPEAPVILSDSHSGSEAMPNTTAHFTWTTPDTSGPLGVKEYGYELKRLSGGNATLVEQGKTTELEKWFHGLQPTSAGESYQFKLYATNPAGTNSAVSTFTFGVSSFEASSTLLIHSSTHPAAGKYYNNPTVHLNWNNPWTDQTVVTQFYYQWRNEGEVIDNNAWISINGQSVERQNQPFGKYIFYLKAVHGAETKTAQKSIWLEFEKPLTSDFYLNPSPSSHSVDIYWGGVTDLDSGLREIRAQLTAGGTALGWKKIASTARTTTFTGLRSDLRYTLELAVTDVAGNIQQMSASFKFGESVDYAIAQPFRDTLGQWTVEGHKRGPVIEDAQIIVNGYGFKVLENGTYVSKTALPWTSFGENTMTNPNLVYQIEIGGKVFDGRGISLDPNGFKLDGIAWTTPSLLWTDPSNQPNDANKQFVFSDVKMSTTPGQIQGSYSITKDIAFLAGWPIAVNSIVLNTTGMQMSGRVDLTASCIQAMLTVSNIKLTDNTFTSANLPVGYVLHIGSSSLTVEDSMLMNGCILVKSAYFSFKVGESTQKVHLGNFELDSAGYITLRTDYYSEAFSYTMNGVVYQFDSNTIDFIDGELCVKDGTATIIGTGEIISLENVNLNTGDDQLIQPSSSFTHLEKFVKGIRVEGLAGYQDGNSIIFSEGTITLPILDEEGVNVFFHVLNLRYNMTAGTWDFAQMTITNPVFRFHNMAYVGVEGITIQSDGLKMAGNVTMLDHLPVGLAEKEYQIENLVMNGTDGVKVFDVKVASTDPVSLYHTYQFTTQTLHFRLDGKFESVYITDGDVQYIGKIAEKFSALNRPADLRIAEISSDGTITKFDSDLRDIGFNFAGLQVHLYTRDLNDETITFGGTVALPDSLPGELSGKTLQIHSLQMNHSTGEIVQFIAYQEEPAPITVGGWSFALYSVGITETEIEFSAGLKVPDQIIPSLAGKYIDINQFVLDRTTGNIKAFDVNIPLEFTFPIESGFWVSANNLGVSLTGGSLEHLTLGFRYAGLQLPPDLGGGVLSVTNLKVSAGGNISYDTINLTGQRMKYKNVMDIYIQNATFDHNGFSVNGTVTLGDIFPEGVKGQVLTITNLHVTNQGVDRFSVSTNLSKPIQLFHALEFTPGTITIAQNNIQLKNSSVKFIGNAAAKITGQPFIINTVTVDYSGHVALDASITHYSFTMLGSKVDVTNTRFDESKITFTGSVTLPTVLPGELSGLKLNVNDLQLTYQGEIARFEVGVNTAKTFNIGKVTFTLSNFTVNQTGLTMAGNLALPNTFPGKLAGTGIGFSNVCMGYDGKLRTANVTSPDLNFDIGTVMKGKLAGFGLRVEAGEPKMVASRLDITLQAPLSGGISFTNMVLTMDGEFTANAQPSAEFKIPLAGSELTFTGPSFKNGEVQINAARLVLPASLGKGSISVTNVRIHPANGVRIGGGEFSVRIPEMKVGQVGLQQAALTLKLSGTQYALEGICKAQVPGIGQFDAQVKLTTISSKYPSGIEQIYVSFKSTSIGLPLGTTGLFINGVYGEFADGPIPSNSPDVVKRIGDGMRFNLGVYVRDVSGGFTGDTGFWVNITNTNSAITGDVSLLSNLVSAKAYAAITNHFKDFYASAQIKVLNCIEGNASFHLWSQSSKTYLTGTSSVRLKLSKGQVLNTWLITIPSGDWWSPSVGTEFGDFKNNVKGVKGYVAVPLFGQVGVFVGNIGFKIGGVDKYILMDRATTHFAHIFLTPEEQELGVQAVSPEMRNFVIDDREYVTVDVPGYGQFASMGDELASASPQQVNDYFVKSTERLVFAVGFKSGDPDIAAIDPAGAAYDKNSPGVEYVKEVGQVILSIPNPKPGAWHLELTNAEGIEYQVAVLGTTPKPEMTFFPSAQVGIQSESSVEISGYGGVFSGKTCYVDLYYDTDNEGFDGVLIAERVPVSHGNISYNWNLSKIPAGQYYIYGKIYDADPDGAEAMPPALMYNDTPVTIGVRSIEAPAQVKAMRTGDEVYVGWPTSDNPDVAGYKVYYGTEMGIYPYCSDVGHLNELMLPLLEDEAMYVGVSSYNWNGEESDKTELAVSLNDLALTEFHLQNVQIDQTMNLLIGQGQTVELPYTAIASELPEGEQFTASLSGLPAGVDVVFDRQIYELYNSEQVIRMTLMAEQRTVEITNPLDGTTTIIPAAEPGTSEVTLSLTSVSNSALVYNRTFDLAVKYPQPDVKQVFPEEVIHNLPREITVRGENFRPDARVFLGTTELAAQYLDSFTLMATVPQGMEAGTANVRVVNSDGQQGEAGLLTVLKPDYVILPLQPVVTIRQGDTAQLYLTLGGKYDYSGQVTLQAETVPAEFSVTAIQPLAAVGGEAVFAVTAGDMAAPGVYTLRFISDEAHSAVVTVQVLDQEAQPQITALNKSFGFVHDTIVVYGSGFGTTGTVTLNDIPLMTSDWKANRIVFILPEGAESGYIVVNCNGYQSTPRYFIVKAKDYSVICPAEITIHRGETVPLTISVMGYSDPIQFGVSNSNPELSLEFTNPSVNVVPNYVLTAMLSASPLAERGSYTIELTASVGAKRFPISVIVETAEIANTGLAEGRLNVAYKEVLDVKNGVAPYQFSLIDGKLPDGIILGENGIISGIPQETGIYEFTVEMEDSTHALSGKRLQILISRDEWNTVGHDEQGSNYTSQPGPSTNQCGELASLAQTPSFLLSNDQHIIIGQGNAVNLYTKAGEPVKQLDLMEPVVDGAALMEQYVFITASGKLVYYQPDSDPAKDIPVFQSTGFTPANLYLYRDQVLITDGMKIQLWNLRSRELDKQFILATPANSAVKGILFDGSYYYVSTANELLSVNLDTQQESIKEPFADTITQITAVGDKLTVLTAMGQLYQFDPYTISAILWHDVNEPMEFVIPYGGGVVVGNATKAITFAFGDKEPVAEVQGSFGHALVAGNRLYAASMESVTAYKLPGLQQVWSDGLTGAVSLIVCNEQLHVVTDTNWVVFNGPANKAVPVSSLQTKPAAPSDSGWYRQDVTVYLYAVDSDNEVAGIYYSVNGSAPEQYAEPITVGEGINALRYYAVDQAGLAELPNETTLQVDSTMPEITLVPLEVVGGSQLFALRATDAGSGINFISLYIGDEPVTYTGPFMLEPGEYRISYYARDLAGNSSIPEYVKVTVSGDGSEPVIQPALVSPTDE